MKDEASFGVLWLRPSGRRPRPYGETPRCVKSFVWTLDRGGRPLLEWEIGHVQTPDTPDTLQQLARERRLARALLSLRLSVFVVMLMWTLDKLINPDHAARVFRNFYLLGGLGRAARQSLVLRRVAHARGVLRSLLSS